VINDLKDKYSMDEINDMTISQIKMYLSALTKQKAVEQLQFITGVAVGAQSDSKGIKKAIKQLEDIIKD